MRARTALALLSTAVVAAGVMAPTAYAAETTEVTFTVTSGGLAVDAPASLALTGAGTELSLTAASISGTMGTVTVTDQRGGLGIAGWTVTVSATDFTAEDADGAVIGTITKDNGKISSGVGTPVSGTPVLVPGVDINFSTGDVLESFALMKATSALGSNEATYTPTVTMNVPADTIPGDYTGTVTQTVV